MKRVAILGSIVTAIVILSGALVADPGGGAWVNHDGDCSIGMYAPTAVQTGYHKVITPSGNAKLTCQFEHDEILDKAVKDTGFTCGIILKDGTWTTTNDSKVVLSPGGQATLVCQIKAD